MFAGLRIVKQLLLAGIAIGVLLALVFLPGHFFKNPVPTPTLDPRDTLMPLKILSSQLLPIGDGDYDVLVRVQNPNQTYGSGDVQYSLRLFWDGTGASEKFDEKPGSFYILPGQTKYLTVTPVKSQRAITRVELHITSVKWQELDMLALRGVNIVTTGAVYESVEGAYGRVRGSVANNSDFDINRVDIGVILLDEDEKPIAINRTEIYTFLAHKTRGFETSWPLPFEGNVARTSVEAHVNLFEQSSFIRTYGGREQFQEY